MSKSASTLYTLSDCTVGVPISVGRDKAGTIGDELDANPYPVADCSELY